MILILLQKNFMRLAVCRKGQSKGLYYLVPHLVPASWDHVNSSLRVVCRYQLPELTYLARTSSGTLSLDDCNHHNEHQPNHFAGCV